MVGLLLILAGGERVRVEANTSKVRLELPIFFHCSSFIELTKEAPQS